MLSTSLRGIISQQLLPTAGKPGRVAAMEILINTPAVANLIRQGKIDQLESTMQTSTGQGMRSMDMAITQLLDQGMVTGQEAYRKAMNKQRFESVKNQT
jgi:twitching motility protein PilT